MSKTTSLIFIISSFLLVGSLKEENLEEVKINIRGVEEKNIGRKGTVVFECSYNFSRYSFVTNTSKETCFSTTIQKEEDSYIIDCGIWSESDDNFKIFCNLEENIPPGEYTVNFDKDKKLNYLNYTLSFNPYGTFTFTKYGINILDLYADNQVINFDKNKDSYEVKFKIVSYHKELLNLYYTALDCEENNAELICHIKKEDLEKTTEKNGTQLPLIYVNPYTGQSGFPLVPYIKLMYHDYEKIDIFIGITNLLYNITKKGSTIAYQTNITHISNVETNLPNAGFEFEKEGEGTKKFMCSFRKYDENPLLIVCLIDTEGIYNLKKISEEKNFTDINIKYNFRVQPVENLEKIECHNWDGSAIEWMYPKILDFTKKDSYDIIYAIETPDNLYGFTYNEDVEDLECKKIGRNVKNCSVTKSHFKGKKNGYYFLKHDNYLYKKSILYEANPVKVILSEEQKPTSYSKTIGLSLFYFSLVILIIL